MPGGPSFSVTHSMAGPPGMRSGSIAGVDALGDGLGGVGIDDEDAVGHERKDGP